MLQKIYNIVNAPTYKKVWANVREISCILLSPQVCLAQCLELMDSTRRLELGCLPALK